jgi:hypothetical protein
MCRSGRAFCSRCVAVAPRPDRSALGSPGASEAALVPPRRFRRCAAPSTGQGEASCAGPSGSPIWLRYQCRLGCWRSSRSMPCGVRRTTSLPPHSASQAKVRALPLRGRRSLLLRLPLLTAPHRLSPLRRQSPLLPSPALHILHQKTCRCRLGPLPWSRCQQSLAAPPSLSRATAGCLKNRAWQGGTGTRI